jgi:hypothetical protein
MKNERTDGGDDRDYDNLMYGPFVPKRPARALDCGLGNPDIRLMSVSDWRLFTARIRRSPGAIDLPATLLLEDSKDGAVLQARPFEGIPLDSELRSRHLLVIGPTGSGKTYRCAVPLISQLLIQSAESIVFTNLKGPKGTAELLAMARALAPDCETVVFAPGNPGRSIGINLLKFARRNTLQTNLVRFLLDAIVTRGRGDSSIWEATALPVIESLVDCEQITSLAAMSEVLTDESELEALAEATGDPALAKFLGYTRSGQNGSTSSTDLAARLAPFSGTDGVRAVTSGVDEFDPALVLASGKRFFIIIECSETDFETERHVVGLFLALFFGALLKTAESNGSVLPRPVNLILDELGVMPPISGLPKTINLGRSRGYRLIGFVQSIGQLSATYGADADALISGFNSTMWICSGLSKIDREYASGLVGNQHVVQWVSNYTAGEAGDERRLIGTSSTSTPRPLVSPDDFILEPHPNFGPFAYLFLVGCRPLLCNLTAAWELGAISDILITASRTPPLPRSEPLPPVAKRGHLRNGAASATTSVYPMKISDTAGWSPKRLRDRIELCKSQTGWHECKGSALTWWVCFEQENHSRLPLVVRVLEELCARRATITEFYLAFLQAGTDHLGAVLHYLDYQRAREEHDRKTGPQQESHGNARPKRGPLTDEERKPRAIEPSPSTPSPIEAEIDVIRHSIQWPRQVPRQSQLVPLNLWESRNSRQDVLLLMRALRDRRMQAITLAARMEHLGTMNPWEALQSLDAERKKKDDDWI